MQTECTIEDLENLINPVKSEKIRKQLPNELYRRSFYDEPLVHIGDEVKFVTQVEHTADVELKYGRVEEISKCNDGVSVTIVAFTRENKYRRSRLITDNPQTYGQNFHYMPYTFSIGQIINLIKAGQFKVIRNAEK